MFRVKTPRRHHPVEKRDNIMTELYLSSLDMQTYTEGVDSTNDTQTNTQNQINTQLEYDITPNQNVLKSKTGGPLSFDTIEVVKDLLIPVNKTYPVFEDTTTKYKIASVPVKLANHTLMNVKVIYSVDRDMSPDMIDRYLGFITCQIGHTSVGPDSNISYVQKDGCVVAEFNFHINQIYSSLDVNNGLYHVLSVSYMPRYISKEDQESQDTIESMSCVIDTVHVVYEKTTSVMLS